jgi:hypothetical protein
MDITIVYKDNQVVNGKTTPIPIEQRVIALEEDVAQLIVPNHMPTPNDVASFIHYLQIVSTNVQKNKLLIADKLEYWRYRKERLANAVASSKDIKAADSGNIRKSLKALATHTWGPKVPLDPESPLGLKEGIDLAEENSAKQLTEVIRPDITPGEMPIRVKESIDDIVLKAESYMRVLDTLESVLTARHFELTSLVKIMELTSYESRQTNFK